jgi:hypothetical protein
MAKKIDHSARKHALLSASGASKWINCTPSPRLEEQSEESTSSYAAEGTLAHEFAEINLKRDLKIISNKEWATVSTAFVADPLYSDDMEDEVQKHVDYVIQQFTEAKRKTKDALLLIEEKVDLTFFIEDGFGTCDVVIIADGVLEVIDLKYGKGVRVSAEDNSQLKLYGLGALRAHELMYDIHTVRLTITQPRMDSISSWEVKAKDLNSWGEEVVIPKAKEAFAGDGEQKTGTWCRFCKAKAKCKALANQNMEIAKHEFADPNLLTDEELIAIYKISSQVQDWLNGVSEHIFSEALKGKKWPDYKLVEGRSNRMLINLDKIEAILLENNFDKEAFTVSKMAGLGILEKLVGKSNFDELLGEHVIKPPGKPTIVPETDKRPEFGLNKAKEEFGSVADENDL